jgi:hypothetical protein
MSQEKPIPNLCPKVILEGTRMTHKTEIAFALNEHPRFVGPRKYRYHSPIISAEWGGLQNRAWGQSLINFDKVHERRALETFDLWLRLIEQLPHLSWIVDRFHHSTMMYQKLYHLRTYHFDRIEARLAGLGFRLVLCYREPSTFAKARMERLKISGNPSQYDNLEMFSREQDELFHLFERTTLPKLIVDTSDDDVVRMTEEVVNWFQLHSAENSQRAGHLSREPDVVRAAPQLAPVSEGIMSISMRSRERSSISEAISFAGSSRRKNAA